MVTEGIRTAYIMAKGHLAEALFYHFNGDVKDKYTDYCSLLDQADQLFAKTPAVTEKARCAVKFLRLQDDYLTSGNKTFGCGPWPLQWTVETLEEIVTSMKDVASQLGLNDSVKEIGSFLFDPASGAELQTITDVGSVFVNLESCTTKQHFQLAKIAAFIAHLPPPSKFNSEIC